MMIKKLQLYIIAGIFSLATLSGCERENGFMSDSQAAKGDTTEVQIFLSKKGEEVITKATSVNDASIRDVNLLVYDVSGNLLNSQYFSSSSGLSITTSTGNKTIVAIANAGNINLSSYTTLNSIRNAVSTQMVNGTNDILMAGETSINLVKGGGVSITLSRLISKVTVIFDKSSLSGGTNINITKIELKNVATQCKFLATNTISSISYIGVSGDNLTGNLEPSAHSSATPLFLFENMQGNIGSAGAEKDKNPGAAQPYCSYLEITANYSTPAKSGTLKYRFYLGKNISNNFDVERNTWYQLNIRFTGTGINEVSWRIDTSNLTDVKYNISVAASPSNGGTVSGGGQYIYGSTPSLNAYPATNYIFTGWSPSISSVIQDMVYTANFQYVDPKVYVTGISVSPANMSLYVGETGNLTAAVSPTNADNMSVTWSSSNPSVATVSNGTVMALAPGTATLTAKTVDGGYTATCNLTVSNKTFTITPASKTIYIGESFSITSSGSPSPYPSWNTSNTLIASVSGGMVTGNSAGTATISAIANGITRTCYVTVIDPVVYVTSVSLDKSSMTLTAGGSIGSLTATVNPSNATNKSVIWSSSNSFVANVNSSGVVSPLGVGSCTITVTTIDGGKTAACSVTVNPATIAVTGVSISPENLSLDEGQNATLSATVNPSNASNKTVTWSTSNSSIATVDANGKVVAISAGTATITVRTNDGGYTSNCNVTVYKVVNLYFYFYRVAKLGYKGGGENYWYLNEPMNDDVYVKATGGNNISGSISYTINWAYSSASGFSEPSPTSGTKSISISSSLNTMLESGSAWGSETDLDIAYPTITVTNYTPSETNSPPTKIRVNQDLNTYYLDERGR